MPDQPVLLSHHPTCARDGVDRLTFQIARAGDGVELRYDLSADLSALSIAETPGGHRRDGLWQHTCFEAFFMAEGMAGYIEFNFAPNGDWAAYQFAAYRQGGQDLETPAPKIETWQTEDGLSICVALAELPVAMKSGNVHVGPSAVIETRAGTKSYWALHHPANKPDFHDIENFKLSLD